MEDLALKAATSPEALMRDGTMSIFASEELGQKVIAAEL